jgi:hypothetical protein
MEDDRQYEDEDKEASKEFDDNEEPFYQPECPHSGKGDIECEFERIDGDWWCLTHDCWA